MSSDNERQSAPSGEPSSVHLQGDGPFTRETVEALMTMAVAAYKRGLELQKDKAPPAPPSVPPEGWVSWMIEKDSAGRVIWWTGNGWTSDPNAAIRFPSKSSAEALMQFMNVGPYATATEHAWCSMPPQAAPDAELVALRRDAERYRYWRDRWTGEDGGLFISELCGVETPEGVDAAIDAALRAKREE